MERSEIIETENGFEIDEVGNATLNFIIAMLNNGWKIKRFIYRGFTHNPSYSEPCWITCATRPTIALETSWFEYIPNEVPKWLGHKNAHTGFNHVWFERKKSMI